MSSFGFDERDNKLIVSVKDMDAIGISASNLCERAAALSTKRMVLDFHGVQFISSEFIGRIVLLNKAAKMHTVDVRIRNVSPNVWEVFKITRLSKVFPLDDDDPGTIRFPNTP